jgi:hypothetical protein
LVHEHEVERFRRCRYDDRMEFQRDRSIVEGLPLERFVGADGLMMLLSLIAQNEMPTSQVLELAKRVQIPGYEQARDLFHKAIDHGMIAPSIGEGFYMQSEIRELLACAVFRRSAPGHARSDV